MTLVETMVTSALFGALGLVIYSLLNTGMLLGARNTAMNTAHQQARIAMLQMVQDFHASVSLPQLADGDGEPLPPPDPNANPVSAAGVSFQLWRVGPLRIAATAAAGQNVVTVLVRPDQASLLGAPSTPPAPRPRLIVRTHELEDDIVTVGAPGDPIPDGRVPVSLTLANNVPVRIEATTFHTVCFITDRCSYAINEGVLNYRGPRSGGAVSQLGNNMTNPTPFNMRRTASNAPLYQVVAAFDLSTADANYTNRGFRSANILLRGEVPMRARLTDTQ